MVVMINPNPPDHPLSVVGVKLDPVVKAAESASLLRTTTHPRENNRSVQLGGDMFDKCTLLDVDLNWTSVKPCWLGS